MLTELRAQRDWIASMVGVVVGAEDALVRQERLLEMAQGLEATLGRARSLGVEADAALDAFFSARQR